MYKQVIAIRIDLKMSKGKTAAQAAHASLSAMEKVDKKIAAAWKKEGQKKVVLEIKDLAELMSIRKKCDKEKIPNVLVADAGLTELPAGTVTALAIGPEKEEKIDKMTGHLPLLH